MSAFDAAVTLAEASEWSLSNLELQKLLYLSQMHHMGEHGTAIFREDFQAWKLGPVLPHVYASAKVYGRSPVRNLFHRGRLPEGPKRDTVLATYRDLKNVSAWDLVAITHWEGGAWHKNYSGDTQNVVIPKADILDEYRRRAAA